MVKKNQWNRRLMNVIMIVLLILGVLIVIYFGLKTYHLDFQRCLLRQYLHKVLHSSSSSINSTLPLRPIIILSEDGTIFFQTSSPAEKSEDETNPSFVMVQIKNEKSFIQSVLSRQEVGLGESFVRGEWSSPNLYLLLINLLLRTKYSMESSLPFHKLFSWTKEKDTEFISHHYDVGNDFYHLFLTDSWHTYSCGIWKSPDDSLEEAQKRKISIILEKLEPNLDLDDTPILDIGCGWGSIANTIAETMKKKVIGLTLSKEQQRYIQEQFSSKKVECLFENFLLWNPPRTYSRIYSIGMFEHVRAVNYPLFFRQIRKCLTPHGRFVLHSIISCQEQCGDPKKQMDSFVTTHIFPGGQIPRIQWIYDALRGSDLQIVHEERFSGQHYAETLRHWRQNLEKQKHKVKDIQLYRKYQYYLTICEAQFRVGTMGIIHLVMTPGAILESIPSKNFVYPF